MRLLLVVMIAALVSGPAMLSAQGQPITQSLRTSWDGAKKNIVQSAEVMPEANYSFKPVDVVRTFGQILGHVAGANYAFCAAAKGEKAPFDEGAFEKLPTKAAIVKAVGDSMAYCDAASPRPTIASSPETIEMPFGMARRSRVRCHEHRQRERAYGSVVFPIKGTSALLDRVNGFGLPHRTQRHTEHRTRSMGARRIAGATPSQRPAVDQGRWPWCDRARIVDRRRGVSSRAHRLRSIRPLAALDYARVSFLSNNL